MRSPGIATQPQLSRILTIQLDEALRPYKDVWSEPQCCMRRRLADVTVNRPEQFANLRRLSDRREVTDCHRWQCSTGEIDVCNRAAQPRSVAHRVPNTREQMERVRWAVSFVPRDSMRARQRAAQEA